VPIRVELRTERGDVVRDFIDPSGGTFDAAGDLDRLLVATPWLLRSVDPYGDTVFNRLQVVGLLDDIDVLATRADLTEAERHGLTRLRAMTQRCRDSVHLYLWFIGD
jgi:hypothetical protein